jgi:hypothetical protein
MAEDIRDISLSSKKGYRIDGDNNRILYLDTSDMNILVRMEEVYPDIQKLAMEAVDKMAKARSKSISDDADEETDEEITEENQSSLNDITEILKEIDSKMRVKLNYIFASDVADICEPTGNMYDPVAGEFRFEHIIEVLSGLYANNITSEFKKMQEKVKKHTAKYTNRRKK